MYTDYDEKLARLIVQYSVNVKEDDLVLIQAPINAESLVREIYGETICQGGNMLLYIHLAIGSGSKNQSAIHWDILKDLKSEESKIFLMEK